MDKWLRIQPLCQESCAVETWICKIKGGEEKYAVEVTLGKPIDILALKLSAVEDFKGYVGKIRKSRIELFGKKNNLERVERCPVCSKNSKDSKRALQVYGAWYVQCRHCSHYFVIERLSKKALGIFYSRNNRYQKTYADERTTETRLKQVAIPKAEWVIRQYQRVYGCKPKRVLDVGAGSGHFVYAMRKLGIDADGIEISQSGRQFCKEHFTIDLIDGDFVKERNNFGTYDLITFWGVIEHVPYPMKMLSAAYSILSREKGLVAVEVPRWDSFGTAVQKIFPDSIARHLGPLGHINCFTDASLATAFRANGFDIVAAWYFGMDAYELVTQLSLALRSSDIIKRLEAHIPALQESIDSAKLSDEVIFAGVPWRKK